MIRTDLNDIDDETFNNCLIPAEKEMYDYIKNNFLYDYIAKYISTFYNHDAMWQSSFIQEVNTSLEALGDYIRQDLDFDKIKKTLKVNHHLIIYKDKPIEIKKEGSN